MTAVHWATDYPDAIGNLLGYATHNNKMREALAATGVEFSESADIAIHVCPPHLFKPIKGKRSILSCAWEATEMPASFKALRYAEVVCPTATFLIEPLKALLPNTRVEYLPLGVDVERFAYRDRMADYRRNIQQMARGKPGKRMRFLWVGAPNMRKGVAHIAKAWEAAFSGNPHAELYLKSNSTADGGFGRVGNVTYDTRRLPIDDLIALYHSAHAFMFPSMCEGFGLTMAEAMATGLPTIYTPWSAMLDLAPVDQNLGYPLQFEKLERDWTEAFAGNSMHDVRVTVANADVTDLANRMAEVMRFYPTACEKAYRASQRIRECFTWERAGRTLRKIVDQVNEGTHG
jgi:glycosyltransferase involved in cell wall biosynthesis